MDSYKKVKQVLWLILFLNLGVALAKIAIGTVINSASMSADGFHSLTDGTSNIIGLIGISIAARPIDRDHPYGHKKYETLAALFIAVLLFIIGGKIIYEAIIRFLNPVIPSVSILSLMVLIITLGINIFVSTYENRIGRKLGSSILISDSMHTRSDIYVSIGVLATLICVRLGAPPIIDPITSLIVAGFIFYASYEIFKDNSCILVDGAVMDTKKIEEIVMSFPQVKDAHNIRSRGKEDDMYVDLHIWTDPDLSVEESHRLIHEIENKMKDNLNPNIQLTIHIEPFGSDY